MCVPPSASVLDSAISESNMLKKVWSLGQRHGSNDVADPEARSCPDKDLPVQLTTQPEHSKHPADIYQQRGRFTADRLLTPPHKRHSDRWHRPEISIVLKVAVFPRVSSSSTTSWWWPSSFGTLLSGVRQHGPQINGKNICTDSCKYKRS